MIVFYLREKDLYTIVNQRKDFNTICTLIKDSSTIATPHLTIAIAVSSPPLSLYCQRSISSCFPSIQ